MGQRTGKQGGLVNVAVKDIFYKLILSIRPFIIARQLVCVYNNVK